ncbi:MAG: DNA polymerase III subunit delta [Calditrichaeota bacterium]|nr:DNA polymerase III subunit delta [Calditrichota bacterium]
MAVKSKKQNVLTYLEAIREIENGAPGAIYFVYGEERFLHDEFIHWARKKLVDPATADFNFNLFYAEGSDADAIVGIARSYPMMAQRRLVIVRDLQNFKIGALNRLAAYAKNPMTTTCLILSFPVKTLTQKWAREILKSAVGINCRELYDNETMDWIRSNVRSRRMEIEPLAVQELYHLVGSSLMNLVNEINKIEINIAPRKKIILDDVRQIASMSRQNTVFDLANAVGAKKMSEALSILHNLLNQGVRESVIVAQLARHFIVLLKIKECYRKKVFSNQEIQKLTKLHPFFINKMKNQVNQFEGRQIRLAFSHLANADYQLKSNYLTKKMVLEILLYNLINKENDAPAFI